MHVKEIQLARSSIPKLWILGETAFHSPTNRAVGVSDSMSAPSSGGLKHRQTQSGTAEKVPSLLLSYFWYIGSVVWIFRDRRQTPTVLNMYDI